MNSPYTTVNNPAPRIVEHNWLDPKEHPMQPGWVVKRWKSGAMWAGYYAGGEKMASCDSYFPLPDPKGKE